MWVFFIIMLYKWPLSSWRDFIVIFFYLDTASVESYMDKQRRVQEKGKDLIVQIQTVSEGLKTNADKFTSALTTEIHKQFNTIFRTWVD